MIAAVTPAGAVRVDRWRQAFQWLAVLLSSLADEASGEIAPGVLERARAGDQRAFAQLVDHYDRRMRALAYRLLGDRERMDDALQEAYLKAYRGLAQFRSGSSVGTWLYRVTYNACLDELRRSRRIVPLVADELPELAASDLEPGEVAACRHDLAAALAALPPDQRAAVLLVDADGLDYAEAGKVLGIPPGTVASRLNRARAALRQVLGER